MTGSASGCCLLVMASSNYYATLIWGVPKNGHDRISGSGPDADEVPPCPPLLCRLRSDPLVELRRHADAYSGKLGSVADQSYLRCSRAQPHQ
jgi:hypothetical protein